MNKWLLLLMTTVISLQCNAVVTNNLYVTRGVDLLLGHEQFNSTTRTQVPGMSGLLLGSFFTNGATGTGQVTWSFPPQIITGTNVVISFTVAYTNASGNTANAEGFRFVIYTNGSVPFKDSGVLVPLFPTPGANTNFWTASITNSIGSTNIPSNIRACNVTFTNLGLQTINIWLVGGKIYFQ